MSRKVTAALIVGVACLTAVTWADGGWTAGVGFFGLCCIAFAAGWAFESVYGGGK